MRSAFLFLCAAAGFVPTAAQDVQGVPPPPAHAAPADTASTHLFRPDGAALTLGGWVGELDSVDVVFVGEQHDDAAGHAFKQQALGAVYDRYRDERTVVLALEMFERDVQLVLDEYLAGLIREKDFLAASRPWSTYASDYRPLVEAARAEGLPVVASNAPARYVSRVGRGESLDVLPDAATDVLPELPVAPASDSLRAKFFGVMEALAAMHMAPPDTAAASDSLQASAHHAMPAMDLDAMLAAQNLRDAAMAEAVAGALDRYPGALVVHVNGSFHSESGLGIPEHLARLRPDARALVLTLTPAEGAAAFDPSEHAGLGDVIGLTLRPAAPVLAPAGDS